MGAERVVGCGYYRAKVAQEELIRDSSIPYTIVHATQFFEFVDGIAQAAATAQEIRLPHVLVQPIAADDLATEIDDLTRARPANGIVEVAGPEKSHLDELVRRRLRSQADPRDVVADPQARYFGARLGERTLMPGADARLGAIRFDDWLPQRATSSQEEIR